ncbi:ABC transporter substrate-binding protein [Clostridium tertium]
MKKLIITLVSTALVVSFLIGFIDVSSPNVKNNDAELIYSVSNIPTDFKAVGSLDKRSQDIITATSRGLVELDENNEIQPSLAESVEVREDGLEYDFKIRSDIYWSDGTRITPRDIATFFREILTEENEENIAALLNVYGATVFRGGEGSFTEDVGISFGEDNIVFRLNSADDKFIQEMTTPQYRVRKNVLLWEDIQKNYSDLIYSGYYSIEDMNMSEVSLKRNDKTSSGIAEKIKIISDDGEEIAMASFEVGGRDIVINPPKSQLSRLNSEGRLISLKSNKTMFLAFNTKEDVLQVDGRREVYRLINKAFEEYQLGNSIYIELAEGSYFRDDKEDLAKLQARKVMSTEEKEWVEPEVLHIVAEEGSENKEICEYLSAWFENNTDIYLVYDLITKDELDSIDGSNYYDMAIIQGDLTLSNDGSIYNNLLNFLDDSNKEKLSSAKTEGERQEIFLSIEEDIFNNYRVLPVLFYNDNIAINKKIKNLAMDGNGNIDFSNIEKS